jgi:hypothetical protein
MQLRIEKTNEYKMNGCPGFAWQQDLEEFPSYPLIALCLTNVKRT